MFKRKLHAKKKLELDTIKPAQSPPEPNVQTSFFDDRRSKQQEPIDINIDRRQANFDNEIPWWLSTDYSKPVLLTVGSMKDIKVKLKS